MQATECPKCRQWQLKINDNYCGYCGHLSAGIELVPDRITLISQIVPANRIQLVNSGAEDISVRLLCANSPEFIRFSPENDIAVKAGSQTEIAVSLAEDKIPPGFMEQEFRFSCIIGEDTRKTKPLFVRAKTGPVPFLLSKTIDFQEIPEGTVAERKLEIGNKGATPLTLKGIQPEGGTHLRIGKPVKFPIKIMPNKGIRIPVIWDSVPKPELGNETGGELGNETIMPNKGIRIPVIWNSVPKPELGNETGGELGNETRGEPELGSEAGGKPELGNEEKFSVRLLFQNHKDIIVPVTAKPVQIRLQVDKDAIHIDPALSKQNYTEKIILTNPGNVDLEISRIESGENWIEIIQPNHTFTLVSAESPERDAPANPTKTDQYEFKVLIRPRNLPEGKNEGKVCIYTAQQEQVLEISVTINLVLPKDCEDYIGIDFGTTNSVIALYNSSSDEAELVEIETGVADQKENLIPSVLVFDGTHENYKIGWDAENEAVAYPENTVRSIKRIMGYGNDREFYGKKFSPDDLAGCIIKKLVELAETEYFKMTGTYYNIRHAIVTVPANFFDLQIRGILKACEYAGLDIEEELARETATRLKQRTGKTVQEGIILDEPSAAAIFYLGVLLKEDSELDQRLNQREDVNFLVFDYGGGTLDVSVVQVAETPDAGTGIKVLANKGNNRIGGDSIDLTVMKQLLAGCKAEFPEFDDSVVACNFNELMDRRNKEGWDDEIWKTVLSARDRWKKAAERVKIGLSSAQETDFASDNPLMPIPLFYIQDRAVHRLKGRYRATVTRYAFEGWTAKILAECEQLVRDALEFAGIGENSVNYIIHTGRSSLIPSVRERVRSIFPGLPDSRDILREEHLKVCVARGAAMYGAQRRNLGAGIHLIAEGRKLPHAYGIGKTLRVLKIFDEIIPLGSPYPTEQTKHYGDDMIRGRMLHLTFYQNSGKSREISNNPDIRRIGDITIEIPGESLSCDVKFMIDANRKLDVYANDETVEIIPQPLEDEERWIG
jgi:molecular chaperone DnaK (HSP70)